jgi:hypothetical protein
MMAIVGRNMLYQLMISYKTWVVASYIYIILFRLMCSWDGILKCCNAVVYIIPGAYNSFAQPISLCILFDGDNISFDASHVYK